MGKTTLTNNLKYNVKVTEGNAGIFRTLQVLNPGASMTIKVDTSGTYCEYGLVLLPSNKKLRPLSSDDIEDLPEIELFEDEASGEIDWREFSKGAAKDNNPEHQKKSWFTFVQGLFASNSGAKADANAGSSNSPTAPQ